MATLPEYTGEIVDMRVTVALSTVGGNMELFQFSQSEGSFTGDNAVNDNLAIDRLRFVTATPDNIIMNRTGTGSFQLEVDGQSGDLNGLYLHIAHEEGDSSALASVAWTSRTVIGGGFIRFDLNDDFLEDVANGDHLQIKVASNTESGADLTPTFGTDTIAAQSYTQNTAIATLQLPEATGGDAPLVYSLSPAVPAGLTFDAAAREITGTPTATQAATTYTYTVTDDDGDTASLTFTITVQAAAPAGSVSVIATEGPNASVSLTRTVVTGATEYQWERRIGTGAWERFLDQGVSFDEYSGIPGPTYAFRARAVTSGTPGAWSTEVTARSLDPALIADRGFMQVLIDTETPWLDYLGQWVKVGRVINGPDRTSGVATGGLFDPIQPTRCALTVADADNYLRDTNLTGAKLWVALTTPAGERYDIFTGWIQDPELIARVDFDTSVYRLTGFDVLARFGKIPVFVDFTTPSSVSGYLNEVLDKAGDVAVYDDSGQPTAALAASGAWPSELRDIAASARSASIGTLSSTDPVSVTQLIRWAEQLDLGVTFVTPSGVVTYADRSRLRQLSQQTPAIRFGEVTATFPSEPITVRRSFGEVVNITAVEGGSSALPLDFVSIDQGSINRFGPREFRADIGPLLTTAEDAGAVALTRTALTRNPTTEVVFEWTPETDARIGDLLSLGLAEPISVNVTEYNLGGNFIIVAMRMVRDVRGVWRATITARQPEVTATWITADSYDLAAGGSLLHDSYYAPDFEYPAGVGPGSTNLGL